MDHAGVCIGVGVFSIFIPVGRVCTAAVEKLKKRKLGRATSRYMHGAAG